MKVFITGGTGFVGSALSRFLLGRGHQVTVVATRPAPPGKLPQQVAQVQGDCSRPGRWQEEVRNHDVVVNLAGASIFQRWDESYKKILRDSRLLTTGNLVDAMESGRSPKITLLSTSAVGYYGFTHDQKLTEQSPPGTDFLAQLAQDWEAEALKAIDKGIRVVLPRFGIVLGKGGGALSQMTTPFRFFMGGPIGSGDQWVSWIHMEDLCRAAEFCLEHEAIEGPVNFTAPEPVTNREFAQSMGKAMGRPSFMPAPGFMIKALLGEFGSVILKGQRVVPEAISECGFRFKYPDIDSALEDLLN